MWASKWRRPCGVARLEDPDVGSAIQGLLKRVVGRSGNQVWVTVEGPGGVRDIEATDILVAAGRIPNTRSVGLDQAGVDLDARGYIAVDDKLQTSAKNIWALGDCAGSPQFTHVGYDDFRVVLSNLTGGDRTTRGRLIPYCLFSDPELAHVGLSEAEAKAKNVPYRVARIPASLVMRMHTLSATRGFVKALVGEDDRILGFTAFCAEASERLAAVQTAMLGGMP